MGLSIHALVSSTCFPWMISYLPNGFQCHLSSKVSQILISGPDLSSEFQISLANDYHDTCPWLSHWHIRLYVLKWNEPPAFYSVSLCHFWTSQNILGMVIWKLSIYSHESNKLSKQHESAKKKKLASYSIL